MLHAWTDSGRPQTTPRDPEFHAVAGGAERRFRQNGETVPYLVITTARSADFSAWRHGALLSGRVGDGKEAGMTRGEAKAPWPEKQLRQRSSAAFTAPWPRPGSGAETTPESRRTSRPRRKREGWAPVRKNTLGDLCGIVFRTRDGSRPCPDGNAPENAVLPSGRTAAIAHALRPVGKNGEDPQTTHPGLLSPPRAHPFAENAPRETLPRTAVPPISDEFLPPMREKSTGTRPISGKNT